MSVVPFRKKDVPHLAGLAQCIACQHRWAAVVPTGVDWMECPACGLNKGRYRNHAIPMEGTDHWVCARGCDVFMVTRTPAFCCNCGTTQQF